MGLVQTMTKDTFCIEKDLAKSFIDRLTYLTAEFNKVIQVFGIIQIWFIEREKYREGKTPIQYKYEDHIPLAPFSLHEKSKADWTVYVPCRSLTQ